MIEEFEQNLIEAGAIIETHFQYGSGLASTDQFLIRYFENKVEFGIKKHFDGWLNSAEFFLNRLPSDLLGVKAMLAAVMSESDILNKEFPINLQRKYLEKRINLRRDGIE